jgi:hypothetical protein
VLIMFLCCVLCCALCCCRLLEQAVVSWMWGLMHNGAATAGVTKFLQQKASAGAFSR